MFERGDAWISSECLFSRDADGDHWLVDSLATLIRTAEGDVPSLLVTQALGELEQVDLAVTYGVPAGEAEVVVAAVTLLEGAELRGSDLDAALRALAPERCPEAVRVVERDPDQQLVPAADRSAAGGGDPEAGPGAPGLLRSEGAEGRYLPA